MILIDMAMPERCDLCRLQTLLPYNTIKKARYCTAAQKTIKLIFTFEPIDRPDWCPLVEVQEKRTPENGILDEEWWD